MRARALTFGVSCAALLVVFAEGLGRWHEHLEFPVDGRGYATIPGAYGTNGGGFLERDLPARRDPGVRRVAVLGDSMTYGTGGAADTFTRHAEAALGAPESGVPWQILNFSQYGYDAGQSAATLRHRVWDYQPDLVVYASYSNDVVPTRVIYTGEPPMPQSVSARRELFPLWMRRRSSVVRRVEGAFLVRRVEPTPDYAFFRSAVDDMRAQARAHGVPLLVFQQVPHVSAGLDRGACHEACREQLAIAGEQEALLDALGVEHASALPYLRGAGVNGFPSANTADWEHPSPAGHVVIGRALADVLRRRESGAALPRMGDAPVVTP
ncbi:MAG: SGNH/GDSL hydrolase family protein [Pseudomonadota bacterium]|nr:SGNH/GDSL hydrolase family protein [Pseudomonadota bacterium]